MSGEHVRYRKHETRGCKEGHSNFQAPSTQVPKTNAESIDFVMTYMQWPSIDLADPEQVKQRGLDYFALCEQYGTKPLISAFCIVMGTTRGELLRWSKGQRSSLADKLSADSEQIFKNFVSNLEVFWEYAMQNDGYRNPVSGIFLGKNNFGYRDQSETIVRHENIQAGATKEQLEAKYMAAIPQEVEVDVTDGDAPELGESSGGDANGEQLHATDNR